MPALRLFHVWSEIFLLSCRITFLHQIGYRKTAPNTDRRGVYVVLTEAGERRHAEAVPTHREVLARHLPASMLSAASSGS